MRRLHVLIYTGLIAALLLSAGCGAPTPVGPTPTASAQTATPAVSAATATTTMPTMAAASATPAALPAGLLGDWLAVESFPTNPAQPGYFIFTFAAAGPSGSYELPMINHHGPLDALTVDGAHITWQLSDRGRTITYAGFVSSGMLTATATLTNTTVPLTLVRLADGGDTAGVLGWYAVDHEHLIAIFRDGDQVYYRDWLTGRMSPLLPIAEDTYVGGPAWQVPAPIETTVTFTRTAGAVTGLLFAQAGQPVLSAARAPDFYTTTEGHFANGDVTLAGTLLTPQLPGAPADARYPAIVMLHGSEPGRRHDTYRWLAAEWLAYYGLATLVYDKRGVGDSTGTYIEAATNSNIDNLAHDALAGLEWLKTQPNIDVQQIGALGASQAGWIGPRMAAASPDVAFLVMVVGPSTSPGQQTLYESLLANHPRDAQAQMDPAITAQVLATHPTPFDPVTYIQAVNVPALWIYGGLDVRVPGYAGVDIINRLRDAGQTNLEVTFYPTASHNMFPSHTGFEEEAPYLPGFIPGWNAAELHWILDHVRVPSAGQTVTFPAADGVGLIGTQYGAGRTAVIFATTSDTHQAAWAGVAQEVAAAGYLALTFDFRFWRTTTDRDFGLMNVADADLLGAVAYARSQGAEQVVVIGASLGGLAAAKIAAPAELDGLVVLGAPMGDPALTLAVTPEELAAATMPKLFVVSADDATVPAAKTQAMYDLAAEPKDLLVFASAQHATDLLAGPHAADLQAALLSFITDYFPTN